MPPSMASLDESESDSFRKINTAIFETKQQGKWLHTNQHHGSQVWQKAIDWAAVRGTQL